MNCPKCRNKLVLEPACHSCPSCGGNWFTIDQAQRFFGFDVQEEPTERSFPGVASGLSCPDCPGQLVHIEAADDLVLDQCARCGGLYFDAGELLKLKSKIGQGVGGPEFRRVLQAIIMSYHGPYR
jgi:Zn-finger nucleic acid-binding protein